MTALLTTDISGSVHSITLARPEAGNSLSLDLVEALHEAMDEADRSNAIAVVLQGAGQNFCTGFDLGALATETDANLLWRFVRIEQLLARLWAAPYLTIAVGKGRVFGAGADVFAACCQRIASTGATFSFPGAGFGLVLGTRRLSVRVGEAAALDLVAGGSVIDAAAALGCGLATALVEEADLEVTIAGKIAATRRLDRVTFASVRAALVGEAALDRDLALLVHSATRTGLVDRIVEFRAQSLQRHQAARPLIES